MYMTWINECQLIPNYSLLQDKFNDSINHVRSLNYHFLSSKPIQKDIIYHTQIVIKNQLLLQEYIKRVSF